MKLILSLFISIFFIPSLFSRPNANFLDTKSRMAFVNHGGLINGGVCWWHSRFQRSAFYLATYNSKLPPPNKKQLKSILRKLRYFKGTVEIPGFENFHDFTKTYKNDIQKLLEKWQLSDGFLYFQWIRGLSGTTKVDTESYQKRMHDLYLHINKSKYIAWTMLQLPGITSHAYLILDMERVDKNQYVFKVIDSNKPLETIFITSDERPALYLGFNADIEKIKKVHAKTTGKFVDFLH